MIQTKITCSALKRSLSVPAALRYSTSAPVHLARSSPVRVANSATHIPARPSLNLKAIAADPHKYQRNAELRNATGVDAHKTAALYAQWGQTKYQLQSLQQQANDVAKEIKHLAKAGNKDAMTSLRNQGSELKAQVKDLSKQVADVEAALFAEAVHIPNFSEPDVPIGPESNAKLIDLLGSKPAHTFPPKDHVTLATHLDLIDLPAGAKVTGTSFYYLKNAGALLELALAQLATQIAIRHGFTPISPPDVVKRSVSAACGFHPRDPRQTQNYSVVHHAEAASAADSPDALVLAATAEIPLAGMHANSEIPRAALPRMYVAFGRAFRAESGARGADTRGLYRVHQFSKVELFALTEPTAAASKAVWEAIMCVQRDMMQALELHARVLLMPTEELGAAAARKVDMEAYMPGRGAMGVGEWGEVSSMSACTDYQARRLGIRTEQAPGKAVGSEARPFVYTLNGTAAAIPRLIVAILEQHQREDGSVYVPKALRPWLGVDVLQPPEA
ncbi:hypothetical protein BCR44DRAFT_1437042 [Catenaria anguillulae PL171]|uniref:serine--tRNA ligase n=1 Tax=Catenaria anguillulae PL171 TaxID=765915 RepID=A0A1Y2HHJ4_9FUNG|nr:hypothetical protein BCR44DRAFT_1437042 [Catenaria anguillulae PL171]